MTDTMDDFIADVYEQLVPPEKHTWTKLASDARRRLAALHADLPTVPAELHPLSAGAVTDEWVTATLDHQAAAARAHAEGSLLQGVITEAEVKARNVQPNPAHLLRAYHAKLTSLMADVADIAGTIKGARTPDAAIAAGRAEQWSRLTELASDYKRLRSAQKALMSNDIAQSARPTIEGEAHASDLYLRNLDDLWPTWRQPSLTPRTIHIDGRTDRDEPWPTEPVPLLIWLATSDAEPWIPTRNQLQELWAERANRANPNPVIVPGFIEYANKYGTTKPPKSVPVTTSARIATAIN